MALSTVARLVRTFAGPWLRRPATPRRAVVALTRRCNCRCAMCRSWDLDPGEEMTPEEVGRLMASMPRLAWLDLTGGEPFIRPDVEEVFQRVLENTPSLCVLHFPTNGWFAERAVACARAVRNARPEVELLVTVSVDGPKLLHDVLRGRPGSFRRALDCFRALQGIPGVQAYIGTTVGSRNRDSLAELEAQLRTELHPFDARSWHWNRYQVSAHFFGNQAADGGAGDDLSLIRAHLRRRWPPQDPVDLMELAYLVNLHAWLEGAGLGLTCQSLHSACFVSADARLYPCHVWDRPLADLREEDFDLARLWAAPRLRAVRAAVRRGACGGCFTPCEAYPALAGSPLRAALLSLVRGGRLAWGPRRSAVASSPGPRGSGSARR